MFSAVPYPLIGRPERQSGPLPNAGRGGRRARAEEWPAGLAHAKISGAARANIEIDIVNDRAGFHAMKAEWNDLFSRAAGSEHFFQSYNWLWHWVEHYVQPEGNTGPELAIVTVRRGGRLIALWPLVRERCLGLTRLAWMGAPVSQYGDVLIDPSCDTAEVLAVSWQKLVARLAPDLVALRKVRAGATVLPLLRSLGARVTERQKAPYLDLGTAADFASYESRYPAKLRKNRRRQMRRLEERGRVSFESHAGGASAHDLANLAVLLKRAWLKDRGLVSPALVDERMRRFLPATVEAANYATGGRVSALKLSGETAGIAVSYACQDRLLLHVIVYGLKFEKQGAGNLLVEACLRDAKAAGVKTVDLMAPGDRYKLDWADGAVDVCDYAMPLSMRGRVVAALYLGKLRPALKSAVMRLPISLRRWIAGTGGVAGAT